MNVPANSFQWPDSAQLPWRRLSREFRLAFVSACIIGLIVHLYMFSNLLLGGDASASAFTKNQYLSNGRWALGFFSDFSSIYQMPVVIGLISIFALALTAGLTVRILELTHPVSIVLTAGLLVSFPTVANTFAYLFTADAYFIALFMCTLAVYLSKNYRFGFFASVILLTVACGIYQAYIPYALTLCLFDCILALLTGVPIKEALLRGVKYILVVTASLILYFILTNAILRLTGTALPNYQGMDTMASVSLSERLAAIPDAYRYAISLFKKWPFPHEPFRIAQAGVVILSGLAFLFVAVSSGLLKQPVRLVLAVFGVLLLPLSVGFICVLAYNASIHRLMIYSFVAPYIIMIKLAELAVQEMICLKLRGWKSVSVVAILCSAMLLWNNFLLTNIGYHSLQLIYETSSSLATRIVDRIETTEGYVAGGPVALVGRIDRTDYAQNGVQYAQYYEAIGEMARYNAIINEALLQHYAALQAPAPLTMEQLEMLRQSEEVASMPCFPAKDSVKMINGVVVVRLNEEDGIS